MKLSSWLMGVRLTLFATTEVIPVTCLKGPSRRGSSGVTSSWPAGSSGASGCDGFWSAGSSGLTSLVSVCSGKFSSPEPGVSSSPLPVAGAVGWLGWGFSKPVPDWSVPPVWLGVDLSSVPMVNLSFSLAPKSAILVISGSLAKARKALRAAIKAAKEATLEKLIGLFISFSKKLCFFSARSLKETTAAWCAFLLFSYSSMRPITPSTKSAGGWTKVQLLFNKSLKWRACSSSLWQEVQWERWVLNSSSTWPFKQPSK